MPWRQQDFNFTSETSALHRVCFDQADKKEGMRPTTHTRTRMQGWIGKQHNRIRSTMASCVHACLMCVSVWTCMFLLNVLDEIVCMRIGCATLCSLCIETTALQCCRLFNQKPSNEQQQSLSHTTYLAPPQGQTTPWHPNYGAANLEGVRSDSDIPNRAATQLLTS